MRIYLQWAKADPEDWFAVDVSRIAQVRNLPRKGVPTATSVLDNTAGWLCGLNCQGIDFSGWDHTAIEVVGEGLRITGWQDDSDDWPVGTRHAVEWTLMPPAPDPAIGGRLNTVQSRRVWAEQDVAHYFPSVLPWPEFVPPASNLTVHGIWLTDQKFAEHVQLRTEHGWREWLT